MRITRYASSRRRARWSGAVGVRRVLPYILYGRAVIRKFPRLMCAAPPEAHTPRCTLSQNILWFASAAPTLPPYAAWPEMPYPLSPAELLVSPH